MNIKRIAISLAFFINGFAYANWIARLPRFQEQYGLDNGGIGLVLLLHAIGALIAMPVTGGLIIRYGSLLTTRFSLLLFCFLIPFFPMMPNGIFLGIWYGIMGAASGCLDVSMNAQAVILEKEMQKPIMSSFHGVFSGGMILGAGAGSLANGFDLSLTQHLILVSILLFLIALWTVQNLVRDIVEKENHKKEKFLTLPHPSLIAIGLIAFCCMLGEGAMADWSTNYLEKIIRSSNTIAPLGLAAFSAAMMIGRFAGDRIRSVLGDQKLLLYSSIIAFIGLGSCIVLNSTWLVIFSFFIIGLGLAVIVPIAYSIAGNVPGVAPGLGISMVTTIGYSGFLFGPPIIGFVADWQNLRIAFLFVLLLFALMTYLSSQNRKRAQTI